MKTLKVTLLASAMVFTAFTSISCKDGNKKEHATPMSSEMHQEDLNNGDSSNKGQQKANTTVIVDQYLSIKDALVADNREMAAEAGGKLVTAFENFKVSEYSDSEQKDLKDIIENAKEQAEHIADSPMDHQREHFKTLSKDVTDMVAITGTDRKLYEQFCPMYDKGSAWLSASNEVRNPYYGSEMLTCGKVQREIN